MEHCILNPGNMTCRPNIGMRVRNPTVPQRFLSLCYDTMIHVSLWALYPVQQTLRLENIEDGGSGPLQSDVTICFLSNAGSVTWRWRRR